MSSTLESVEFDGTNNPILMVNYAGGTAMTTAQRVCEVVFPHGGDVLVKMEGLTERIEVTAENRFEFFLALAGLTATEQQQAIISKMLEADFASPAPEGGG